MPKPIEATNDFVVKFANTNGSGSASANELFARAILRMGVPIAVRNIFPSNIQGLPTWYEVRISEKGYLGRREGVDIMLSVNPQSMPKDIATVKPNGYFIYDNTKELHKEFIRDDIHYIGVPMMQMCMDKFADPRQRQLLKNMIYHKGIQTIAGLPSWPFPAGAGTIGAVLFWVLNIETDWPEYLVALLVAGSVLAGEVLLGWSKFELGGVVAIPYAIPALVLLVLLMIGNAKSR